MALEKKGGEGDITHTHRQTHKHTGNDAGNCCTWMSTHTHTLKVTVKGLMALAFAHRLSV